MPKINWCFCCTFVFGFYYSHHTLQQLPFALFNGRVFALSISPKKFERNARLHSQECMFFFFFFLTQRPLLPTAALASAEISLPNSYFQSNKQLHRCTLWLLYVCCRMLWALLCTNFGCKNEIDIESANLMRCFYLRLFVINTHKYTLCSGIFAWKKWQNIPLVAGAQKKLN